MYVLNPFRPGEGATFPGGVGRLPIRFVKMAGAPDGSYLLDMQGIELLDIEKSQSTNQGGRYFLDAKAGTITAATTQGVKLAFLRPSLPLTGLRVRRKSQTELVLASEFLTLGFHADGLLVFVPHRALALRLHSLVAGGSDARLDGGRLHLPGGLGGFTVVPEVTPTPSRPPNFEVLTPRKPLAKPHWEARWRIAPGQRLAVGLIEPQIPQSIVREPDPQVLSGDAPDLTEQIDAVHTEGHGVVVRLRVPEYPESARYLSMLRLARRADGVVLDGLETLVWTRAYACIRQAREIFPGGKVLLAPKADDAPPLPPFVRAYADGEL